MSTMTWKTFKHQDCKVYAGNVEELTWDAVTYGLLEMWTKLLGEIIVLPREYQWDTIYLNLWMDSGRVIGYPGNTQLAPRNEPISVDVLLRYVKYVWFNLDNPTHTLSVSERDERCGEIRDRVWHAAVQASLSPSVQELIISVRQEHPFVVTAFEYDGDIYRQLPI